MNAIQVRFLAATDFKGARLKASIAGNNSITVPFQYELSSDNLRAIYAAECLIEKLGLNVLINDSGCLPSGDYAITLKMRNKHHAPTP
jgi:hypothetical protein